VLEHGLFDTELGDQLVGLSGMVGLLSAIFGYVPGPRTKTSAENRLWRQWGAQVNSMTLAPEVILANELEIATAAVVVGHKYSLSGGPSMDEAGIRESLERAREGTRNLVRAFLTKGESVSFKNHIYRFDQ
jgi:purine nucleoside phosphorylase